MGKRARKEIKKGNENQDNEKKFKKKSEQVMT